MSLNEATYKRLYEEQRRDMQFIKSALKVALMNNGQGKWLPEAEASLITGLSVRSLRSKRAEGVFRYSAPKGRKVQYLRTDIENYLSKNSNLV